MESKMWDTRYSDLTKSLLEVPGAPYTRQVADATLQQMYNTYTESERTIKKSNNAKQGYDAFNERLGLTRATDIVNEKLRKMAYSNPSKKKLVESVITTTSNVANPAQAVVDFVGIFYPQSTIHFMTDALVLPRKNDVVYRMTSRYGNTSAGQNTGQIVFQPPEYGLYASLLKDEALTAPTGGPTYSYSYTTFYPSTPGTNNIYINIVNSVTAATDTLVMVDVPSFASNTSGLDFPQEGTFIVVSGTVGVTSATGTIVYSSGAGSLITLTVILATNWTPVPNPSLLNPNDSNATQYITYNYNYQSDDFTTTQINSLYIDVENITLNATAHPIKLVTSTEVEFQLNSLAGVSAINSNQQAATGLISLERDLQFINGLQLMAGTSTQINFNAGYEVYYPVSGTYSTFETVINAARSLIQNAMGRGTVTTMVTGSQAADIVMYCPSFKPSGVTAPVGPYLYGTLQDGAVTVIKNPFMDPTTYLLYFKGYGPGDAPVLYGNWIEFYATPDIQMYDLNNYQTVASFYDMVPNWLTTPGQIPGSTGGYVWRGYVQNYQAPH
jgi:hypothetical protein